MGANSVRTLSPEKSGGRTERRNQQTMNQQTDISELAEAITAILATAIGRVNAITAAQIGDRLDMPSRRVREIISKEFAGISERLSAPLVSVPPCGFWLSTEVEDLRERDAWLLANRDRYDASREAHRAMCARHGLAGVLNDLNESPATKPTKKQTNKRS